MRVSIGTYACMMLSWISCLANEPRLQFERDVRPILKAHCFHCHGEESKLEGGLDTRLVRQMVAGGDSGPAIVVGSAERSLLWKRIQSGEMPPKGKGLSPSEQAILRKWLDQGAPTARPEPVSPPAELEWTEEERNYWAFRSVERPALPVVRQRARVQTPIDHFLLAELESQGRSYAPPADLPTLARRLALDLTGLPPTPERTASLMADQNSDAIDRYIDELLASPAYGERWARHWLDPAGYADSDGIHESDRPRPWAYRYRDYVITALNRDKPFDQFIIEQLAGDELVAPPYKDLSPEDIERLTATGFLRTAPDGTGEGNDQNLARNEVIADTIKVLSTSLLGITVGCAQCHTHRYDPISHEDYYRLRAVLEPALDWKQWRDRSARLVNLWTAEEHAIAASVDQSLREIEGQRRAALNAIVDEIFEKVVAGLSEPQQLLARQAKAASKDQRTPDQIQILKDFPRLNVNAGSAILYEPKRIAEHNKKFEDLIAAAKAKRPPENYIACLTEVPDHIPVTYRFERGDINQPRNVVRPGELSILPDSFMPEDDPSVPTTGRRLALARNLTSGQHPLVARNLVNRFWMHLMGRGIVATPGDFGRLGELPSHPALLDWLADEFVRCGWSLKALQRLIVRSAAYQQSSMSDERSSDPENRYWGRMPVRRLEAEAIRDSMLEVSGMRTKTMYGTPSPVNPDEVGQIVIGNATRDGNGIMVAKGEDTPEKFRRGIYIQVRRTMPLGMLEPFDLATLSPNCDRRAQSTVAPQSLLMMNNEVILTLAERFASRLLREVGNDQVDAQVKRAWWLAFGQSPAPEDLQAASELVQSQRTYFQQRAAASEPQANEKSSAAKAAPLTTLTPEHQALALLCQAIFCSNRFLYVD